MANKVLNVPFYNQPTNNTCQSTCLKMYGHFLEIKLGASFGIQGLSINDIWKDINESGNRPSKLRNAYVNMVWWLNKFFPMYQFNVKETINTDEAMLYVVKKLIMDFR